MADVLWQGLTQSSLDQQLNLRARWPSHQEVLERWARDSAALRARLTDQQTLAYGDHRLQRVDLFRPAARSGPLPLLVFVHGGYWQSLDKDDFSFILPPFLDAGIAVASVNYRMAPEVRLGEICADVTAALDLLSAEAAGLGCQDQGFVLCGHSAGGHLVMQEAVREGRALAGGEIDRSRLAAVCSISGIYDLAPLQHSYQQIMLQLSDRDICALSPLRNAPLHSPPVLVAVGDQETPEFLRQQTALISHWQALDLPIEGQRASGQDHFTIVDLLSDASHAPTRWLIAACLENSRREQ